MSQGSAKRDKNREPARQDAPANGASPAVDAFAELMRPKPKQETKGTKPAGKLTATSKWLGAAGLQPYIERPQDYSSDRVIFYDDNFVGIRDLFPKSSVHTLLLPRDMAKTHLSPFEAYTDLAFRDACLEAVAKLKTIVASELRRIHGKESASEQVRMAAMAAEDPPEELPAGRDWEASVKTGFHAVPSMSNLHIHVISIDHVSDCMKRASQYNSFCTSFLVPLERMPIDKNDQSWSVTYLWNLISSDLICWRCHRNFGRKFAQLKQHLDDEFAEWKRE